MQIECRFDHGDRTDTTEHRQHKNEIKDARLLTSLTAFRCLRVPKAVNDVRSRASARKTGVGIWRRSYGADFWSRFLERVSGA